MGFWNLFTRERKPKYVVDKKPIENETIARSFQFLIDSGYRYEFYQKNSEREFVYTLEECRVEVFLVGNKFDCVIQATSFPRSNILKNPLVGEEFEAHFLTASNQERINMIVNLLRENADIFLLK